MTHRLRLVSIVVVSFLTSVALAFGQGQSASSAGLGFSGGLSAGAYKSLGTVPALSGQLNANTSGKFYQSARRPELGRDADRDDFSRDHYGRQYDGHGYDSPDLAFWVPGYFYSAYYGGGYADAYNYVDAPYAQSGAQQNGNQSQGSSQNQGMNGGQSQSQSKQGQGKKEAPPQQPQYLTYTPKKESLQEKAKTGKAAPVDFKSDPSNARVTVDGYFVGHTPTTVQIPLGKHLVSISKWGYESAEQEIDVTGKKSVSVNSKLSKDW